MKFTLKSSKAAMLREIKSLQAEASKAHKRHLNELRDKSDRHTKIIEGLKKDVRAAEAAADKASDRHITISGLYKDLQKELKRTEADLQRALGYIERVIDEERDTDITIVPKGHKVERVHVEPRGPNFDTYPMNAKNQLPF